MKKLWFILLGVIVFSALIWVSTGTACNLFFWNNQNQSVMNSLSTQPVENISSAIIPIEGMTCGACAAAIKAKLKALDGMIDCSVSYKKSQAVCRYDSKKLSIQEIKQAINKTGYRALD